VARVLLVPSVSAWRGDAAGGHWPFHTGAIMTTDRVKEQPTNRIKDQQPSSVDKLKGNWKQFKGQIQQKWGKLTEDDLMQINGRREELIGRIQQRHGAQREEIERELNRMIDGR
jgi:uncharacterized protein YjbJ (UPF0337 family)